MRSNRSSREGKCSREKGRIHSTSFPSFSSFPCFHSSLLSFLSSLLYFPSHSFLFFSFPFNSLPLSLSFFLFPFPYLYLYFIKFLCLILYHHSDLRSRSMRKACSHTMGSNSNNSVIAFNDLKGLEEEGEDENNGGRRQRKE